MMIDCSPAQARHFFAALCYANNYIAIFEKLLLDVPEDIIPVVLLASIVFENCGLAKIKEYIPAALQSPRAYWVPIPNQYILRDRAWLFPVIRACDPDKRAFSDQDYSNTIVDTMAYCLGISIETREKDVYVDIKQGLSVLSFILDHPEVVGLSKKELNGVMSQALTDDMLTLVTKGTSGEQIEQPTATDDFSRGLTALVFMVALFASSCLLIGHYCLN